MVVDGFGHTVQCNTVVENYAYEQQAATEDTLMPVWNERLQDNSGLRIDGRTDMKRKSEEQESGRSVRRRHL